MENSVVNLKKILLIFMCMFMLLSCKQTDKLIDLSGKWKVKADTLTGFAFLPGTLSENSIGYPVTDSVTNILSEQVHFTGKAIYEREVEIPQTWVGKTVELFIERTKVSQVFINGELIGSQNSVSVPHVFLMKDKFRAGKNVLTISVDNTKRLLPLGGAHAYSEHTQTNWNGILGVFYIRCLDDIDIRNVQAYAQTNGDCRVKVTVLNTTAKEKTNQQLTIRINEPTGKVVKTKQLTVNVSPGISVHEISLTVSQPKLWDEYNPHLYKLTTDIAGNTKTEITFGFRNFIAKGKQFTNNNRIVFLRGTHEGGISPLTGYPSMHKKKWIDYYTTIKSYGINHVRYHSWTPPQAAFQAADECGIFIQPELPLWGSYTPGDTILFDYMQREGEKIMQVYGNHPSFVLFALGNELTGDTTLMAKITDHLRDIDNRHLYAFGSNNFYWDTHTHPLEDFFVSMRNGKELANNSTDLRGSFSFADSKDGGIINRLRPNTERNFSHAIATLDKPVVGHEIGQYQVYPNYKEMSKYTGVLQPRNFAVFKKRLEKAGMITQAEDFLKASGALCALCYREEIEMALRTPNFGGFQLLDLKDYPGQGTALVGILDVFLDSKDIIDQGKWLEFCNDVVPLAAFSKFCWLTDESFTASIKIANYSEKNIINQPIHCTLSDKEGNILFNKIFQSEILEQGQLNNVGEITIPLNTITKPQQLELTIWLSDTVYRNSWNIWVYPSSKLKIEEGIIGDVLVTRNKTILEQAKNGNRPVLYIPHHEDIAERSVGGLFITDFWNYGVFRGVAESMRKEPSPGTMGLLMNPAHPLLKGFPTDFHTNWQWWNIVKHSRPIILDDMSKGYLPIVQVIDNIERNHKLGLLYELPETTPKVLVCAADLFACANEPEVKALFQSLLNYLRQ